MTIMFDSSWINGCVAALVAISVTLVIKMRRSPWDYLDGPPSTSFLLGLSYSLLLTKNETDLINQGNQREFSKGEVGQPEFEWLEKYGAIYPYKSVLGVRGFRPFSAMNNYQ